MNSVVAFALVAVTAVNAQSVVLTDDTFNAEVVESGKNAFVKFYAPWCGHCKSMKPAWEELGTAFSGSSSVIIGDVDCTVQTKVAGDFGVSGYPTIKYFTAETDPKGDAYSGGRDLESLKKFVEEKLERKCDATDPSTCSEKEQKFIAKMADEDAGALTKELTRLNNMKDKAMKADQKAFMFARIYILEQLTAGGVKEDL